MANSKSEERDHSIQNKEDNAVTPRQHGTITTKTSQPTTRVKVQWPKSCSKVFPSCRNTAQQQQPATTSVCTEKTDDDDVTAKQEKETYYKDEQDKDDTDSKQQEQEKHNEKTECKNDNRSDREQATMARLRAQRRWRMGLLKRSKLGGIGGETDVSDLFPDYFPSPFAVEEGSEDDDILTSLKESKQRHRAKLLKQNSIDKIDRELGDRETKLIAGSWLQIYS